MQIDVSFIETRKPEITPETQLLVNENKEEEEDEEETTDDSSTFNSNSLELSQLLSLSDETEKAFQYKSKIRTANTNSSNPSTSSSSVSSSPEQHLRSVSKRRFFPWGQRSKIGSKRYHDEEIDSRKTHPSSNSNPQIKETADTWENTEIISRDRKTKLKSKTFFASIDQRDESAGGESACTALVAVIADKLLSKHDYIPNRLEFDNLIREGSSEWQKLCSNISYVNRFHNKHFDLDTILEAKIRDISVSSEKSFIGFFQPESFESFRGAMSFDDIWNEIASDVRGEPRIYIVSWNDHFFVLKVECDNFYIIDTLGERLFEGCTKAYMLKFDDSAEMYGVSEKGEEAEEDELICRGKECCREFIKRFLAAIPLREELEIEEKGTGNPNTALHQRLQIEVHLTQASSNTLVVDEIDWSRLTQASSNALIDNIDWWSCKYT